MSLRGFLRVAVGKKCTLQCMHKFKISCKVRLIGQETSMENKIVQLEKKLCHWILNMSKTLCVILYGGRAEVGSYSGLEQKMALQCGRL
jgi:hypothetical protein